jgi:hypothetical protein
VVRPFSAERRQQLVDAGLQSGFPSFGRDTKRVTIATKWNRIDEGGIEALNDWCARVKEPVMIVIDVFAKVRAGNTKNKPLYEADYGSVVALQELPIKRGIAVVLIHHDRKMEAEDPFDTVSGRLGLTGAADTILILKRSAAVTLHARGRDIEEAALAVQFDKHTCKWTMLGEASEVRRSDERDRVIEVLRKASAPLSVKDIMTGVDMTSRNAADLLLGKMAADGAITRVGRGQYALAESV